EYTDGERRIEVEDHREAGGHRWVLAEGDVAPRNECVFGHFVAHYARHKASVNSAKGSNSRQTRGPPPKLTDLLPPRSRRTAPCHRCRLFCSPDRPGRPGGRVGGIGASRYLRQ